MRPLVLVLALAGCGRRTPETTIERLVGALAGYDFDRALALEVSPEMLAEHVQCAPGTKNDFFTAAGRRKRLDEMVRQARGPTGKPSYVIALKPESPIEPYYPEQWKAHRAGDTIYDDCRAVKPFEVREYRIVLIKPARFGGPTTTSTKPIKLWKLHGNWYAWDDPLDTEI